MHTWQINNLTEDLKSTFKLNYKFNYKVYLSFQTIIFLGTSKKKR